ncbi:MAG: RHS repeat-associated core domain-containing protein, partial [Bacteroidota bacterium]
GENGRLGSIIAVPVLKGDRLTAEVFAKYVEITDDPSDAVTALGSNLLGAFTDGFQVSNEFGSQTINSNFGTGSLIGTPGFPVENGDAPMAFLNLMFLPDGESITLENGVTFAFDQIDINATQPVGPGVTKEPFDLMKITEFEVPQKGYVMIYLSNESNTLVDVHFDDLRITLNQTPVIQTDDQYPFGLSMEENAFDREDSSYKGQVTTDGLALKDLGFRQYDPVLGRFHNVDPLGEIQYTQSLFQYAGNDPVGSVDVLGLSIFSGVGSFFGRIFGGRKNVVTVKRNKQNVKVKIGENNKRRSKRQKTVKIRRRRTKTNKASDNTSNSPFFDAAVASLTKNKHEEKEDFKSTFEKDDEQEEGEEGVFGPPLVKRDKKPLAGSPNSFSPNPQDDGFRDFSDDPDEDQNGYLDEYIEDLRAGKNDSERREIFSKLPPSPALQVYRRNQRNLNDPNSADFNDRITGLSDGNDDDDFPSLLMAVQLGDCPDCNLWQTPSGQLFFGSRTDYTVNQNGELLTERLAVVYTIFHNGKEYRWNHYLEGYYNEEGERFDNEDDSWYDFVILGLGETGRDMIDPQTYEDMAVTAIKLGFAAILGGDSGADLGVSLGPEDYQRLYDQMLEWDGQGWGKFFVKITYGAVSGYAGSFLYNSSRIRLLKVKKYTELDIDIDIDENGVRAVTKQGDEIGEILEDGQIKGKHSGRTFDASVLDEIGAGKLDDAISRLDGEKIDDFLADISEPDNHALREAIKNNPELSDAWDAVADLSPDIRQNSEMLQKASGLIKTKGFSKKNIRTLATLEDTKAFDLAGDIAEKSNVDLNKVTNIVDNSYLLGDDAVMSLNEITNGSGELLNYNKLNDLLEDAINDPNPLKHGANLTIDDAGIRVKNGGRVEVENGHADLEDIVTRESVQHKLMTGGETQMRENINKAAKQLRGQSTPAEIPTFENKVIHLKIDNVSTAPQLNFTKAQLFEYIQGDFVNYNMNGATKLVIQNNKGKHVFEVIEGVLQPID